MLQMAACRRAPLEHQSLHTGAWRLKMYHITSRMHNQHDLYMTPRPELGNSSLRLASVPFGGGGGGVRKLLELCLYSFQQDITIHQVWKPAHAPSTLSLGHMTLCGTLLGYFTTRTFWFSFWCRMPSSVLVSLKNVTNLTSKVCQCTA